MNSGLNTVLLMSLASVEPIILLPCKSAVVYLHSF